MSTTPRVIRKRRSTITIHPNTVTKRYHKPSDALTEINWYLTIPQACPQLLEHNRHHGTLTIARHPIATHLPDYQPITELIKLLELLESRGIHHRDIHPGNIVATPNGPRLIDWETAIHAPNNPSYDLHGPDVSGIPIPDIHRAIRSGYTMWIGSTHRKSIRNTWKTDAALSTNLV